MTGFRPRWLIAALLTAACLSACLSLNVPSSKSLSAKIIDTAGKPIAGAVFYAEAYLPNEGAFDFAFAISDENGLVPGKASQGIDIEWRRGARLALAAFAEDYQSFAVYDYEGLVQANGINIPLQRVSDGLLSWEPFLGHFTFPFEKNAKLAQRLRESEYQHLRSAFMRAYDPLLKKRITVMPREQQKIQFLAEMDVLQ